jgi:hypothetical protein
MANEEGNLDSPSILVIYYHTRFISVASMNCVRSPTHPKGKINRSPPAHFVPTHSPRTPPQLYTSSTLIAVATLKLDGCRRRAEVTLQMARDFAPIACCRLSASTCTDFLDSDRLGFSAGLGGDFPHGEGN